MSPTVGLPSPVSGAYALWMSSIPDHILTEAIAKRDAALADAERWSQFVAMYSEISGVQTTARASAPATKPSGTIRERPQSTRGGALAATEKVAIDALRAAGKPLQTRDLLVALEAAGVEVGGKDPASTLSARLSRADGLENVRPYGWRIREHAASSSDAHDAHVANVAAAAVEADFLGFPEQAVKRPWEQS